MARDVDIQACARDLNTEYVQFLFFSPQVVISQLTICNSQSKSCLKIREAYVASVAKDYGPDY